MRQLYFSYSDLSNLTNLNLYLLKVVIIIYSFYLENVFANFSLVGSFYHIIQRLINSAEETEGHQVMSLDALCNGSACDE